jgi:outer membrane protein assembly factor BamB
MVNTAVRIEVQAPEPTELEVEGTITAASTTSITVHDSHGTDVILALTSSTVIRKGDQTITAADLKVGDHVHVQAVAQNMVNTATEVIVQGPAGGVLAEADGTVTAASGGQLTVHTEEHGDVIVKTDASTTVRKQGTTIAVSDIHVGDSVSCIGTTVGDHTILAKQIEVHGGSGHH